jgi:gliding motility-associated-like protein
MRTVLRFAAIAVCLGTGIGLHAQTYLPIPVTGFNHDIFADAYPNALTSTDTVLDATNHVMYTQGFATSAGLTGGLPNSGLISDAGNVRQFQLAPYNANNSLGLMRNVSGALTLATPGSYSKLSLLAFATENAAAINVSVRFTDNSTSTYLTNYSLPDWFFATTNVVISGFGRINRVAAAPYGQDGVPSNPRFYYIDFNLTCADQAKTVSQVLIQNVTTAGTNAPFPSTQFLALSGQAFTQTATAVTTNASCAGNNGSATLSVTGSASPFTVSWNTTPVQTGLTASGLAPGNYTATITNSLGCTRTVPVTISQATSAVTTSASATPSVLCNGTSTQLSVSGTGGTLSTATWTPGNLAGTNVTVSPVATTTYTVNGTDQFGCSFSKNVTVTVNQPPAVAATNDATVCGGSAATLTVQNPQAGVTYNWYSSFNGGTSLFSGSSFQTPPINSQAVYYVEAVSSAGCVQTVRTSASAFVTPPPAAPAAAGQSICGSGASTLNIQGPAAGVTYNWYTAATGGASVFSGTSFTTPSLSATTTYYVEAVGSSGCIQATRTPVTVTIAQPPAAPVGTASGFCPGGSATLTVQNPSLLYTYSWFAAATGGTALATGLTYNTAPLNAATTFYLEAASAPGCTSTRTAVTASPFVALAAPVVTVSSAANGSISFSWSPVAGAIGYEVALNGSSSFTAPSSGPTGTTHTVSGLLPGQSSTLVVRALGVPACRTSAPSAPVTGTLPGTEIYVPTAFTPNGDGRNDVLLVYGAGISAIDFRVFDQWGAEIFRTQSPGAGWDGTRRGKAQPSGVYVYAVEVTMADGSRQTAKGAVNLIR